MKKNQSVGEGALHHERGTRCPLNVEMDARIRIPGKHVLLA